MPPASSLPRVIRFASFEADFRAGELRKEGRRIRLQEQPLQVLAMLVERPHDVVTREELQQTLWPADTFVDFDHGLNSAVARLRDALCDSAERPKYIETVARRGYRFIAKLEQAPEIVPAISEAVAAVPIDVPTPSAAAGQLTWRPLIAVLALGVAVLAIIAYVFPRPTRSLSVNKTIDSIAVLPFENAAADPETGFLADGITQSAIDHLSRLGNIKVISMQSVSRYREKQTDPRQVGHELGVRSVMTGRIAFHGDRMAVMAELVDASDGTHIWGKQYDRKVSDIMNLQEEIASDIAGRLESRLSVQQEQTLRKRYAKDFETYQIYLRGRYYWNRRSQADLQRGIAYFQQALERDPNNALAYAGLADSYFVRAISGAVPTAEAMPKAKEAALKALELDDSLAEAHTSLAQISANYEWNWSKAEAEYKRAINLNPNYSTGHHYYASFLMAMGRHSEAMEELGRAQELDPLSPIIATFFGKAYFYAGQNEEAIRQYRKVLESDPSFPVARSFLIGSLEQAGRFDEAVQELRIEAAQEGRSPQRADARKRAFRKEGPRGYWKESLRQIQAGAIPGPGSDLDTAAVYAKLEDKDTTFALLDAACDQRNMWLMNIRVDPRFESLRSDSRYQQLLRRIGLGQAGGT